MSRKALIAIGGNQGDVQASIETALHQLDRESGIVVTDVSRIYQTVPMGAQAGDGFLNAACEITFERTPVELLDVLQEIEQRLDRVRTIRWGPRSIDLDIIGIEDLIVTSERLMVPHPACWYRRFVLDPLHDITPEWIHPQLQTTVTDLLQQLQERPLAIAVDGHHGTAEEITNWLTSQFVEDVCVVNDEDMSQPFATFTTNQSESPRAIHVSEEDWKQTIRDALTAMLDKPVPISESS